MTIDEFLVARITEDEAVALLGIDGQADPENGWGLETPPGMVGFTLVPHVGHIHRRVQGEHIVRWSPARVLAECEAKRRIIGVVQRSLRFHPAATPTCPSNPRCSCDPCLTMRALAMVYAAHSDYDESWRVG